MLKFFRRLRRKLLDEGKMRRYLIYAIGEILLVVIGILIALQINNWNSNRLNGIAEYTYLTRLSEDIKKDTINFSWIARTAKSKQEMLERILNYINSNSHKTLDTVSLFGDIANSQALSWTQPDIYTGTIEELKSSGNFNLIKNTDLRMKITEYYFEAKNTDERIEKRRMSPNYGSEIQRIFPDLTIKNEQVSYKENLVSKEEILAYLKNPEFKKLIIAEYNLMGFLHLHQSRRLEHSKKILADVVKEMEER